MSIKSLLELKDKFKAGAIPTGQDWIDLLDSFLLADQSNFPAVLPAVDGHNLTNLPTPSAATINVAEFNVLAGTPSYLSSTSFQMSGNLVSYFYQSRRLELVHPSNSSFVSVASASYNAGTDKTIVNTYEAIGYTTINSIKVALVNPLDNNGSVNRQAVGFRHGGTLASATSVDVGFVYSSFDVSGTASIEGFSHRAVGDILRVRFTDRATLVHSSSLALLRGENVVTDAGEIHDYEAISGGWRQVAESGAAGDAGEVKFFAMSAAPVGFLKCNGAAVSRTTYKRLFAKIGTTFGTGDGSTTFNIPDLRGEFIRGFDDGRGVDSSRVFGSAQADDFKSHYHSVNNAWYSAGGTPDFPYGGSTLDLGIGTNTQNTGGTETRPRNVALLACIRY